MTAPNRKYRYPKSVEMYNAGHSIPDIASELGVSIWIVRRYIRDGRHEGIVTREYRPHNYIPLHTEIVRLLQEGLTQAQVADKLNMTQPNVSYHAVKARAMGITFPYHKRGPK